MKKINGKILHFIAEGIVDNKNKICAVEILSRGRVDNEAFFKTVNYTELVKLSKTQIEFFLNDCGYLMEQGIKPHINVPMEALLDTCYIEYLIKKSNLVKVAIEINGFIYTRELIDKLKSNFIKLQNVGHEIWLDDFGDDKSSVSLIMVLPWSGVKIDKAILWNGSNEQLTSLVSYCFHWVDDVIIEGVESRTLYEKARGTNANYSQGYLFKSINPTAIN